MTEIVPAIDIIDGRCVRLTQGDYGEKKVYDASPLDMALRYADCGVKRIHMVDLDGAKASEPRNLKVLEQAASKSGLEIEWGGGIALTEALGSTFDAGATQAIIGSVAALKPDLFKLWLATYGPERILLGSDVREGVVAVKGWLEKTELTIQKQIEMFLADGLKYVICTDISRDGMLKGPSFDLYSSLMKDFPSIVFTASGGMSSMTDIEKLAAVGMPKAIVGKAIYENRITFEDIRKWQLQNA